MRTFQNGRQWLMTGLIFLTLIGIPIINFIDWRISPFEKKPWSLIPTDPSHSMIISWESNDPSPSYVRFGLNPSNLNQIASIPQITNLHHVLLTNLSPGTKYYYQVGPSLEDTPNLGTEYSFITAPDGIVTGFNFTIISDTQQMFWGNGYTRRVVSALSQIDAAFVSILGDMVDDGADQANWDDFFEQFNPLFAKKPLVAIAGNHDKDISRYFPISANPELFFYSFNYSMVHFTILHIYSDEMWDSGVIQQSWLVHDLAAAQSLPFRIVFIHCPVKSSSYFGNLAVGLRSHLLPLLQSYHVQLLLSGHDHHYERFTEGNLTMMISGGGGAMLDPFALLNPDTDRIAFSPNYIHIWANTTSLEIKTIGLERTLLDQVLITR